ncbi:hypothetical protein LXL04_018451 [Taraxacum kok-saghyz]
MPTAPPGRPHQYRKRTFHEEDEESDDFLWWNKMITGFGLTISNKSTEWGMRVHLILWQLVCLLSVSGMVKGYSGVLRLGEATSTLDADSPVIQREPWEHIKDDDIKKTAASFCGEIWQVPPMFSAIKVGGKRLDEKARRGENVELSPRRISIFQFDVERSLQDRLCIVKRRCFDPKSPPLHKLSSSEEIEDIEGFFPVSDSQKGTTEECYAIEDGTTPEISQITTNSSEGIEDIEGFFPVSDSQRGTTEEIGTDRFPRPHRLVSIGLISIKSGPCNINDDCNFHPFIGRLKHRLLNWGNYCSINPQFGPNQRQHHVFIGSQGAADLEP